MPHQWIQRLISSLRCHFSLSSKSVLVPLSAQTSGSVSVQLGTRHLSISPLPWGPAKAFCSLHWNYFFLFLPVCHHSSYYSILIKSSKNKQTNKHPKTQQTQTTNQPQILKSKILLPFITDSYWFLTLFLKRAAFLPYLQLIYHCYNCGWKVSLYGLSIWTLPVALLNREHCETVLLSCKMQHNLTNRLTLCWNIYPFLIAVLKWQLDFALPQVKSCLHVKGDRQACCQK